MPCLEQGSGGTNPLIPATREIREIVWAVESLFGKKIKHLIMNKSPLEKDGILPDWWMPTSVPSAHDLSQDTPQSQDKALLSRKASFQFLPPDLSWEPQRVCVGKGEVIWKSG